MNSYFNGVIPNLSVPISNNVIKPVYFAYSVLNRFNDLFVSKFKIYGIQVINYIDFSSI